MSRAGMRALSVEENGSRLSWPICARSSRCASATVRPMGPLTLNGVRLAGRSTFGTTPGEGRKPATPQNDAGVRRLPPRSEPVASGTWPERQRHRRAAGRAGAGLGRIERIAGRAVDAVGRVGAGAELGRVGLAENDAAGPADVGDVEFVLGRHVVLVEQRAPAWSAGPAVACRSLTPIGQSRQQPGILAAPDGLLDRPWPACAPRPHPSRRWR